MKRKVTVIRRHPWFRASTHQPLTRFEFAVTSGPVQGHSTVFAAGVIGIDSAFVDEKFARLHVTAARGPHQSAAPEGILLRYWVPAIFYDRSTHAEQIST